MKVKKVGNTNYHKYKNYKKIKKRVKYFSIYCKREEQSIKIGDSIIYEVEMEGFMSMCNQFSEILLDLVRIYRAQASS